MYGVVVALQAVSIVVLMLEVVYMVSKISNRGQAMMFLFVLEVLINNIGYMLELLAESKQTAFMGTCVSYIGKSYLLLTVFAYVMYFCQIKIPKVLTAVLMIFHSAILIIVFGYNKTNLYYTSVEYVDNGWFSHLELGKGPMYMAFMIMIGIYTVSMIGVLIRQLGIFHTKYAKKQIWCLLAVIIVCFISLILTLSGITCEYDCTALGYLLSAIILLYGFFRNGLFDTLKLAKEYVVDNMDAGVIVLDMEDNLLYYNAIAEKIYTDLNTRNKNAAIEEMKQSYENDEHVFATNRVFHISSDVIDEAGQKRGIVYLLSDVTDTYDYTEKLESDVKDMSREVTRIQHAVISGLADMVEARDDLTGMHIHNTSLYVAIVAKALQKKKGKTGILTDAYVETMVEAAPLHDIGKITVSDTILCKPGKLTAEEYEIMKTHAARGAKMIDEIIDRVGKTDYLVMAKDMAYYHHEKWDGTGYPQGLKGEEIPICARIMAIADVYDALRSKRSYKEEYSEAEALQIIKDSSGTHFDPELVEIFVDNILVIQQV